jgi:hypothetical protein
MGTEIEIAENELEEIPSPHLEPRIVCRSQSPRQVSNNLTLIDGNTLPI